MRVTIDYTPALRQGAGIGRYTRNLVDALARVDATTAYTLFCAGAAPERRWPPNFTVRATRLPSRWLTAAWHKLHLPLPAEVLSGRAEVFHSPDFTLPPLARARGIVTVHDLSYLRLPHVSDPGLRAYLAAAVPRAVRRAVRVLADSENTRRDVVELLGASPDKVTVVPGGVEERFRRVTDPAVLEGVRLRYALPYRFILFLGTLEPRKNLPTLISAFARLRRARGLPHRLVIGGREGWLYDEIYRRVKDEGLHEEVRFIGYTKDEDLPALYTLADLFAFPSLYEGFGLPPLEALACGTPVVAANNSSLPEAVGDAGLLVDANDVDGLAAALGEGLFNEGLRAHLAHAGPRQAARFPWESAARRLAEVYRGIGAEARG